MTTVKDIYVIEAKAPDFKGLAHQVSMYEGQLKGLATTVRNALNNPAAKNLTQQQVERLTSQLLRLEEIAKQIGNNKSSILAGDSSIDLSKTTRAVSDLRQEVEFLKTGLSKTSQEFLNLDKISMATGRASGKGLIQSATMGAGGKDQLAENQLREKQLDSISRKSVEAANAAESVAQAFANIKVTGLVRDSSQLAEVFSQVAQKASENNFTIKELEKETLKVVDAVKRGAAAYEDTLDPMEQYEEAQKRIADANKKQAEEQQKQAKAIIDAGGKILNTKKAIDDANKAVEKSSRFKLLGGKAGADALKEITDLFAKHNLTLSQQEVLAERIIDKYMGLREQSKQLTVALNKEGAERAKLQEVASKEIAGRVGKGADPAQAARALEAVKLRLENGEIKDKAQLLKVINAEMAKQVSLNRAATDENKVQYQSIRQQREEESRLTAELIKVAKATGAAKELHGDLRSVISQTVAEARALGLTYAANKKEVEGLLQANVELKKLQAEAGPKTLNDFGVAFGAGFAADQIIASIRSVINVFTEFEDELIKVRRTADASRETMHVLGQEILTIGQKVPVAAKDLAAAAAALGQTGAIAFKPGVDYARTATEMQDAAKAVEIVGQTALVSELNIEQAATAYGQFTNVFSKDTDRLTKELEAMGVQGATTADAMRVLFGAVNEVGNQTVATTADLLDFTRQFAGVGSSLGIAAENVIILGGAFRDFQVSADVAGTAASRFFSRATSDAAAFGKVLGISGEAFRAQFSTDALGTIIKVFKEVKKEAETNKLAIADFFDSIGGVEVRERNAFTKLIDGVDELERRLEKGSNTLEAYNSVKKEADKRSESFSASIQKLSNAFTALVVTLQPALDILGKIISAIATFVKYLADNAWAAVVTSVGLLAAGLAAVTLLVVKMVAQFRLATSAINAMTAAMREYISISGKAPTTPGGPPPGGKVGTSAGGAVVSGALAVAAVAGTVSLFREKGKESGEAFAEGVKEGVKEGSPGDVVKKEVETSWAEITTITALGVASLTTLLGGAKTVWTAFGGTLKGILTPLKNLAAGLSLLPTAIRGASTAMAGLSAVLSLGAGPLALLVGGIAAVGTGLGYLTVDIVETVTGIKELNRQTEELNKRGQKFAQDYAQIKIEAAKAVAPFVKVSNELEKQLKAAELLVLQMEKLKEVVEGTEKKYESSAEALQDLLNAASIKAARRYADAFDKIRETERKGVIDTVKAAEDALKKQAELLKNVTGRDTSVTVETGKDNLLKTTTEAIEEQHNALRELRRGYVALQQAQETSTDRVQVSLGPKAMELLNKEIKGGAEGMDAFDKAVKSASQNIETLNGIRNEFNKKEFADALENAKKLKAAQEEQGVRADKQKAEALAKAEQAAIKSAEKMERALKDASDALLGKTDDAVEKTLRAINGYREDGFAKLKELEEAEVAAVSQDVKDEIGARIRALREQIEKTTEEALREGLGEAARAATKESFEKIKEALASFYKAVEADQAARLAALEEQRAKAEEGIRTTEEEIEQQERLKEAIDRARQALETLRDINRSSLTAMEVRYKNQITTVEDMAATFFNAAREYQEAWVNAGKNVEDTFAKIAKAAKDTAKAIKQSTFNFGLQEGEKSVKDATREKLVKTTLRQSSDARKLVDDINAVTRKGKTLSIQDQGKAIGKLIAEAEKRFDKKGVDASAFLEDLREKLAEQFLKGKDTKDPAAAIKEVGGRTNELLESIRQILKGENSVQQSAAISAANKAMATSDPSGVRSAAEDTRYIDKENRERRDRNAQIRKELEAASRTESVQQKKEAAIRKLREELLDAAIKAAGLDKKKGTFTNEDAEKARKVAEDLLNNSRFTEGLPTDVIETLKKNGVPNISIPGLEEARKRLVPTPGATQGTGPGGNGGAEGVTQSFVDFSKSTNALLAGLQGFFTTVPETINGLTERVDKLTTMVTGASGTANPTTK